METVVSSETQVVIIGSDRPVVFIGERINPTGKTRMTAALKAGDMEIVKKEALSQVQTGADIIDVNADIPGADTVSLLPKVVQAIMETVDVPLCLDSDNPKALEAALAVYRGKPLVNSISGKESSLNSVLPLVKKYGAAVIGLTIDDKGIPTDAERRVVIARHIIERAEALGIPRNDVVIDCLALAISTDSQIGLPVLEAIRQIRAELGVNQTIGASNVSYGLPDRYLLTNAFLAIAIAAGVTCPILDVAQTGPIGLAADLLLGHDDYAKRYLKAYRKRQQLSKI